MGHGTWGPYLKDLHISGPTAWRAIRLYKRAGSSAKVATLGITAAYLRFGILSKAKATPKTAKEKNKGHNGHDDHASESIIPLTIFTEAQDEGEAEDEAVTFDVPAKGNNGDGKKPTVTTTHRQGKHRKESSTKAGGVIPPPKENPDLPLAVLVKVKNRLAYLQDEHQEDRLEKGVAQGVPRCPGRNHQGGPATWKGVPRMVAKSQSAMTINQVSCTAIAWRE